MTMAVKADRDPARRRADLLAKLAARRDEALAANMTERADFWADYIEELEHGQEQHR